MTIAYYPRPKILANPGFRRGHVVIEASAGTGKTFTLEHLVLDLIINNRARIEEILVVTFTDAATRELRERVRSLIRRICDEGLTVKPTEDLEHYWAVDDVTRNRLQEALFRFDGAAISTIHGFCQRILSEQAFLGGFLFKQEQVDGREIFGPAFREEIRRALAEDSPVGNALKRWIEEENRLEDLQALLYQCHREGCPDPDRSLLTPLWDPVGFWEALKGLPEKKQLQNSVQSFFTNRNQKNGYLRLLNRLFETVGTFSAGEEPDIRQAVETLVNWLKKECSINKLDDTQINHLRRAAAAEGAPDPLKRLSVCANEMALRAASEISFFVYCLLPRIQRRLRRRKLSLGLIDYDDMLLGVREALRGENAPALLDILRRRWKFALVDEFQDTDPVQWEIFKKIFVEGKSGNHLYIIGDPKQAIYGFRGADVHTYDLAKNHLLEKYAACRLPLEKNYRSTEEIIEAVNAILTGSHENGNAFFCGLNRYDEPVKWGKLTKSALEGGKPGSPVHLMHFYSENEAPDLPSLRRGLAHFIAGEIFRLTDPKSGLFVYRKDKLSGQYKHELIRLGDIYILTRSTREGRQIGEVLRRYGIHHAFYKLEGLFKTAEAEEVYRLLTAIVSPQEPAARMAAWLTPFFEIPLKELPSWRGVDEHHPLIAHLLNWKRLADSREWARLFDDILTTSGLIRRLIFFDGERELTNYLHIFELLLAEAHARPVTLSELTRGLKALIDGRRAPGGREGDMQRLETDKEAVQILTMHKAKGLEAEVIFWAGGLGNPQTGAFDTRIYHQNNRRCLHVGRACGEIKEAIDEEERQENQRLAYVALTRARSRLYLPYFGENGGDKKEGRFYGYHGLGRFYRLLQDRLELLRQKGLFGDRRLFLMREVSVEGGPRRPGEKIDRGFKKQPWEQLSSLPSRAKEAEKIKPGRRGVLLTSYTRMSRGESRQLPAPEEESQAGWRSEEVAAEIDYLPVGPTGESSSPVESSRALPGGRETGIFLHALLEETKTAAIAERSFEHWSALPEVQDRAATSARRHGFPEVYLPEALHLVYSAFRTPLKVLNREKNFLLEMPGGIASGKRPQAEMSFVFPIPESFHPLLAKIEGAPAAKIDPGELPFRAHRGYLRGLIDLVFEHEDKIYLVDWKSDSLSSFEEENINDQVKENYSLQAQIYRLAVLRLLDIRWEKEYESLFGGILYLFIRGMGPPTDTGGYSRGAWFSRPSWREVLAGEQRLVGRRDWGGEVITVDAGSRW